MKNNKIKSYKGFDKDLKCRNFQYEVGKEYETQGEIKACKNGFHACENPMDVFEYYAPSDSRYCEVRQSGVVNEGGDKTVSSKIRVQCEIGLSGIVQAGVKFILDKINWANDNSANTGDYSAATNTGDYSAATNTGDYSAAKVDGKESIAIVTGKNSKASGALGCWLVLTERGEWNGETYPIKEVKAVKVDGEMIKANTFYSLINGKIKEVE